MVQAAPWRWAHEHIDLKEGRASLMIQRRAARSVKNLGRRHLGLGDNLTSLLAYDKGRSSSCLNVLCKRSAAYQLGGWMSWRWRHVDSARHVADRGSRLVGPDRPRAQQRADAAAVAASQLASQRDFAARTAVPPPPGLSRPFHPGSERSGHVPSVQASAGAVLELFAGRAGLSRAFSQHHHHPVVINPIDINRGSEFDMTCRKSQDVVLTLIRGGGVGYVHIGLPCKAWAASCSEQVRASRSAVEKERVCIALTVFAVEVIRACDSVRVGWSLENPANSGLWRFPPISRMLDDPDNHTVIFQSCCFGDAFRRNIMILTSVAILARRLKGCKCPHQAGHRHAGPSGLGDSGRPFPAGQYPDALCRVWAAAIAPVIRARRSTFPLSVDAIDVALRDAPRRRVTSPPGTDKGKGTLPAGALWMARCTHRARHRWRTAGWRRGSGRSGRQTRC